MNGTKDTVVLLRYLFFGVSGMTLISQVKVLSRVVTAKCPSVYPIFG